MLIESVLNKKPKTFAKVFENVMADKVAQALDVLHIVEGRKLLLGKVEEDELDEGRSRKEIPGQKVKEYAGLNRKMRRASKVSDDKKYKHYQDRHFDRQDNRYNVLTGGKFPGLKEDELEESGLLLKQNRRGKKADKDLQKGAVRGDSVETLKGYRAKTKYHNLDTVNRFRVKSGKEPLGKISKYRDKINALKAKNPKRLPEEEIEEGRYQGSNYISRENNRKIAKAVKSAKKTEGPTKYSKADYYFKKHEARWEKKHPKRFDPKRLPEEELDERHIGFKKLEGKLERKGYSEKSAGAIAASIGRKKYGSSAMKKAAATGKAFK